MTGSEKSTSQSENHAVPSHSSKNLAFTKTIPELIEMLKISRKRADKICAHVQSFRNEAGIPAINEMRYAGYHLSVAVDENGCITDGAELLKAVRHYERATYEAAEAGIMHALAQIGEFKEIYKRVTISDIIPDWVSCLVRCGEAQEKVGAERETGDGQILDHELHQKRFDDLVTIVKKCDAARDELNKKINENVRESRNFIITAIIGVLAILATIIFGIL